MPTARVRLAAVSASILGLALAGGLSSSVALAQTVAPSDAPGDSSDPTLAADPGSLAGSRPNIVLIMLDDVPADIMPRLLRRMPRSHTLFKRHGLRFPHFFVQDSLCCPARVGFLTGLYAHHHRVRRNMAPRFRSGVSLATALDGVGYHTMLVGKYLNNAYLLSDRVPPGWDRVVMFANAHYYDYTLYDDEVTTRHGHRARDYSTDVLAEAASTAITDAPSGVPLFLLWAPAAVHNVEDGGRAAPPQPAPRHRRARACRHIRNRLTPAYNERRAGDKPRWVRRTDYTRDVFYSRHGYPLAPVCRALLSVDEGIWTIVEAMRTQGRGADTLFILTADNGMGWGDHRRRAKSVPWSTPTPLYMSWRTGLGEAPGTVNAWTQNIDIAPTIAALAGTTLGPFPTGQDAPDGLSLVETLASRGAAVPPRTSLLEDHKDPPGSPRTWQALRTTDQHPLGLWHYIEWRSGERELYDLATDPWKLRNVVARRPDTRRQLATELHALLED